MARAEHELVAAIRALGEGRGEELEALVAELALIRCARCDALKQESGSTGWCPSCEEAWTTHVQGANGVSLHHSRNTLLSAAAPILCLVAVPILMLMVSLELAVLALAVLLALLFVAIYRLVPVNEQPSRDRFLLAYRDENSLPSLLE